MIPLQDELVRELKQTLNSIKLEEKGVYVQASTLGSLEALLEFLRVSKVPVSITHTHTHRIKLQYSIEILCCNVHVFPSPPTVRWHQHRSSPQERRDESFHYAGA